MKPKKSLDKNIVSTIVLIVIIAICFFCISLLINKIASDSCLNILDDSAVHLTNDIRTHLYNDREHLEVLANILAEHQSLDSDSAIQHLSAFRMHGEKCPVALLFPDNTMLFTDDTYRCMDGTLDFDTERKAAPYISDIRQISYTQDYSFFYQVVPVKKDGEICAFLYEFVDLKNMFSNYSSTDFEGNAKQYIIDGNSGFLIMNSDSDDTHNIFDASWLNQESSEEWSDFIADIKNGIPGSRLITSTDGTSYYCAYKPLNINNWSVLLAVPRQLAFADAIRIHKLVLILAGIEAIVLLIHIFILLSNIKKHDKLQEYQLKQLLYMYDVQQTLFDAHEDPDLLTQALQKVATILTADTAFLITLDGAYIQELFSWSRVDFYYKTFFRDNYLQKILPQVSGMLLSGKSLVYYAEEPSISLSETDKSTLAQYDVSSFMLLPVLDSKKRLVGALGSINMKQKWADTSLLECIARDFLMALHNVQSYRHIQKIGTTDALTGLKNRNSYERALKNYSEIKDPYLCCLYMDANGLHELNNHLGHTAGDEMLIFIGKCLIDIFGEKDSYRIGGDEFVTFCHGLSVADIENRISEMKYRLDKRNYHVSIGLAWRGTHTHIDRMITTAERRMYEAKHKYYEEKGDLSKAREMNQKLEQILLEKKDADTFLSIISSYFRGVYVVNPQTDDVRTIYKQSHFSNCLEKSEYKFMPALVVYIDTCVHPDSQEAFRKLLDFETIKEKLKSGENIEYTYLRQDGVELTLRIYPGSDYSRTYETFWLFQDNDNEAADAVHESS